MTWNFFSLIHLLLVRTVALPRDGNNEGMGLECPTALSTAATVTTNYDHTLTICNILYSEAISLKLYRIWIITVFSL